MANRADPSAPEELDIADVRWLIGRATASGEESARVERIAELLVDALLDLQAFRNGDHDPRRQRSLSLAQRIVAARAAGADMAALQSRFRLSRSQINRHCRRITSRATHVRK